MENTKSCPSCRQRGGQIKIIQCPDSQMWYWNKIGQTIAFQFKDSEGYWCQEDGGYINKVEYKDAKLV